MTRLLLVAACVAACSVGASRPQPPAGTPPLALPFDHLEHLGIELKVGGRPVRVISIYADAPHYRHTPSPSRDGSEGIACVDDAARAAVLYLRQFERTRDPQHQTRARALLEFVLAMERDGEWLNFIDASGQPNLAGETSKASFSWWAARALWALGEAARVLRDPAFDAPLERAVARLEVTTREGRLIASSSTATAEALLGLTAWLRVAPSVERTALAGRLADMLVALPAGPLGTRLDHSGAPWHAWGDRAAEALAEAAVVLGRPELATSARREADGLWVRFLVSGDPAGAINPDGAIASFPQIAYGVSPIVLGYLALARATGESRYSTLAGLAYGWFAGANRAGVPMFDDANGRGYDGLRGPTPADQNRSAGAESTIEAMLALQGILGDPVAATHARHRPQGPLVAVSASTTDARVFEGPRGDRLTLSTDGKITRKRPRVELTYWPAANPIEVELARQLVAKWNEENPDVHVRMQPLSAGRSSEEVLLAALVGRSTPDVCSNVSTALLARLVRAGGLVRVDTLAPTAARLAERTTGDMVAQMRLPDGGLYAFPWKANPTLLLYNIDLLAAANVDPPRTHSQLLAVLRALAADRDRDGRRDRWGLEAGIKTTWYERFFDFYPLYLASSGGRTLVERGQVVFDNAGARAALAVLGTAFAENLVPRSTFPDGSEPFLDGTVAMKLTGPYYIQTIELRKQKGLRYDAAPVPVKDDVDPATATTFGDVRSIAIFSTTRHPDEAARFVAFLTSPEADRILIELTAQLPLRRGLASDTRYTAALASWPALPRFAPAVERLRDLDIDPDVVEIFDLLSEAYEAGAVYGTQTPEQAISAAAAAAREVVDAR